MTQIAWLTALALKGTVVLSASFAAAALLGRASAATRHFLWTTAFAALLLLPLADFVAPQWVIRPDIKAAASAGVQAAAEHRAALSVAARPAKREAFPWLLVWALGCGAAAARFAAGLARTRRMIRQARPAGYAQGLTDELRTALGIRARVAVLDSAEAPAPLACGLLKPAIVLPSGAPAWRDKHLRTVLRHELAHIRRRDLAAQALGQAACCLYWFHPLAWMAARRLREERERACDDAVLAAGTPAHEYAGALADLARDLVARRRAFLEGCAATGGGGLESRIRTLLDRSRSRRPLGARTAGAIATGALALLLPMAAIDVRAQAARGSLTGVVEDPSRARVPDCQVAAKNQDASNQEITRTNAAGEYRFGAIPPGNYVLEFSVPGFAVSKRNAVVTAGQASRLDVTVEVGSVAERLTVRGQKPSAMAPVPNAGTPQRIRVGGNVQPLRLLWQSPPEYPAGLQQLGVEGTVVVRGVVSVDGRVLSPQVVNTDVDARLAQLALDSVKQWRYQPSLLNGQPVETVTTVTIDFTLDPAGRKSQR